MGDWLKVFVVFRWWERTEGPYAKVGWFENVWFETTSCVNAGNT